MGTKIDNVWAKRAHLNKIRSSTVAIYTRSFDTDEVIR